MVTELYCYNFKRYTIGVFVINIRVVSQITGKNNIQGDFLSMLTPFFTLILNLFKFWFLKFLSIDFKTIFDISDIFYTT